MLYDSNNNKIRAVYNQTETENLDVNLEATHSQNNRPFYETNTMYFKDENDFFEVPININIPSTSNLKDHVHIFIVYKMERQNIKRTNDFTAIFGNKGNGSGIYRMLGFQNLNPSTKRLFME